MLKTGAARFCFSTTPSTHGHVVGIGRECVGSKANVTQKRQSCVSRSLKRRQVR
jgi:hypothetical protein